MSPQNRMGGVRHDRGGRTEEERKDFRKDFTQSEGTNEDDG